MTDEPSLSEDGDSDTSDDDSEEQNHDNVANNRRVASRTSPGTTASAQEAELSRQSPSELHTLALHQQVSSGPTSGDEINSESQISHLNDAFGVRTGYRFP